MWCFAANHLRVLDADSRGLDLEHREVVDAAGRAAALTMQSLAVDDGEVACARVDVTVEVPDARHHQGAIGGRSLHGGHG